MAEVVNHSEETREKNAENSKPVRYKYCVVPACRSSTHRTPHKLFFSMPRGEARNTWAAAMGRGPQHRVLSLTCNRVCCEDHFNLAEDMENYLQWKLMGRKETKRLVLRKGVIPHKFDCQNRITTEPQIVLKKQVIDKIEEKELEKTLDRRRVKKRTNNNKKWKVTEYNLQDKKVRMTSDKDKLESKKELISEQRKKLEKYSNVTQEAETISQENVEKYTFQIKIEAEEVTEEPDDDNLNVDVVSNTCAQDSSVSLDIRVKVEQLDEEFQPEVLQEVIQEDIVAD